MRISRREAAAFLCLLAGLGCNSMLAQTQAPSQTTEKSADAFFAGIVEDVSAEHVSVSRVTQGKTEKRDFHLTSDTKIEGRLRAKVRVTVRYTSSDDGDTATLIIIRAGASKK